MGNKRTNGAGGGDRADRAQEIGLFRYGLIRPVADPALTTDLVGSQWTVTFA